MQLLREATLLQLQLRVQKHTTPRHRLASGPPVTGVMRMKVDRNLLLASLLSWGFGRRFGRSLRRGFRRGLRYRFGSALDRDLTSFHFRHTFLVLMVNVNCLTRRIMPALAQGSKCWMQ